MYLREHLIRWDALFSGSVFGGCSARRGMRGGMTSWSEVVNFSPCLQEFVSFLSNF